MKKLMIWYLNFYPSVGTPPNRRLKIHLCYWLFYFIFCFFSFFNGFSIVDRIVISAHLVLLGSILFYFPTYLGLPLLFNKKYFYYGILVFFLIYVVQYFEKLGFNTVVLNNKLNPPNGFSDQDIKQFVDKGMLGMFHRQNLFREIYFASQAIMIPFFLKFSRLLLLNSLDNKKIILEKGKLEVAYLRSQINPHFLLNTINNIYSQIVTKDETAPESIIALSDLMKYLLHQAKVPSIPLTEEIHFVQSYIHWEQLKDNKNYKIYFSNTGVHQEVKIAPLLLINFIENAFKHAGSKTNEKGYIKIQIDVKSNNFEFIIENSKSNETINKTSEGGVGLKNVTQRLNLLYPKGHQLFFNETEENFTVKLNIQLNKLNLQND